MSAEPDLFGGKKDIILLQQAVLCAIFLDINNLEEFSSMHLNLVGPYYTSQLLRHKKDIESRNTSDIYNVQVDKWNQYKSKLIAPCGTRIKCYDLVYGN